MFLDLSAYHMTYDQEFSVGAPVTVSPDGNGTTFKTQFDWGGRYNPSNHEAEFYSDPAFGVNPFSMQAGEMTITAAPAANPSDYGGQPYTSGLITTETTFSQHGGYFEVRAQVPGKAGLWGAFWMLPTNYRDYPELDVLEDPNLGPKGMYFLHATAATASAGGFVQSGTPIGKGYHAYGLAWTDQTVTFFFDHKAIAEYPTPSDFASLNMYLLLNLAVGGPGSWPGAAPAKSIPGEYKIDYIRAFSSNAADPAVAQQAVSSPDAVDTTPSYVTPRAPDVVTGTGPGSLTLAMSEDFFDRDAKFQVAIDGVAVPGVFDVVAQNAKGQTQKFIFNGTYAPGLHSVTVTYVNSLAGSAPYLSRKLYFNGMTVNGAPGTNLAPMALHAGAHTMSFIAP